MQRKWSALDHTPWFAANTRFSASLMIRHWTLFGKLCRHGSGATYVFWSRNSSPSIPSRSPSFKRNRLNCWRQAVARLGNQVRRRCGDDGVHTHAPSRPGAAPQLGHARVSGSRWLRYPTCWASACPWHHHTRNPPILATSRSNIRTHMVQTHHRNSSSKSTSS